VFLDDQMCQLRWTVLGSFEIIYMHTHIFDALCMCVREECLCAAAESGARASQSYYSLLPNPAPYTRHCGVQGVGCRVWE